LIIYIKADFADTQTQRFIRKHHIKSRESSSNVFQFVFHFVFHFVFRMNSCTTGSALLPFPSTKLTLFKPTKLLTRDTAT